MRKSAWHADSWNKCIKTDLPELLAERLPVASYTVERKAESLSLKIGFTSSEGADLTVTYENIPSICNEGVFRFEDRVVTIVPRADSEKLESISCCGEQLMEYLDSRVTSAPDRFFTDEQAVVTWIPLSDWISEFFLERSQVIDNQNAIARMTHLNRIIVEHMSDVAPAIQLGKACPIETPEGPNIGKVLTVAKGAVIEQGAIRIVDESPDSLLGPAASMIPFVERSDPARTLMGANMLRQWTPPLEPELPIVATGFEPEGSEYANGFNLLTAFISLGVATCEDGLVLSESAVARMSFGAPVAVGDKLSNRNGQKGVVSEIRPDDHMPKMSDGTTVDLVCGVAGLHTRMNTGQLFEALAGRIARATGSTYLAPPFGSRSREEMGRELVQYGLPEDGLEEISLPGGGEPVKSVAGWIYWGLTAHIVSRKIKSWVEPGTGQRVGAMEYWVLRDAGCNNVVTELMGVRSTDHPEAGNLVNRIFAGNDIAISGESRPLARLAAILKRGGLVLDAVDNTLSVSWDDAEGYPLAKPVKHPWSTNRYIETLYDESLTAEIKSENERLRQLNSSNAPDSIVNRSYERLQELISDYFDGLFSNTNDCLPTGRAILSGRSVIVPSQNAGYDEIGIPFEMARLLFAPLLGDDGAESLDVVELGKRVRDFWLIVNRAPSINETSIIGFRPVIVPHQAIELNPLYCRWLNGDFDGDQVAIFPLVTVAARGEVASLLSPVGQISRDPSRIDDLVPPHESTWGIVQLWREPAGRTRIEEVLGVAIESDDPLLRVDELMKAVRTSCETYGAEDGLKRLDALVRAGFDASLSCSAMSPFMPCPVTADVGEESAAEAFAAAVDIDDPLVGDQLVYARSGIRGSVSNFVRLTRARSETIPIGQLDGLSRDDLGNLALDVRRHLNRFVGDVSDLASTHNEKHLSRSNTVIARAARSKRPGVVFGSAADRGEVDPLTDIDAQLFAGLIT